jgi:hypothetical protein
VEVVSMLEDAMVEDPGRYDRPPMLGLSLVIGRMAIFNFTTFVDIDIFTTGMISRMLLFCESF